MLDVLLKKQSVDSTENPVLAQRESNSAYGIV